MGDWQKAQELANFVLLRPKDGTGWSSEEPSLRGESDKHYSSLRFFCARGDLRVRLKQTLNDWWVPVANDFNLRRVDRHVLVGDELIFVGTDYHRKPGACAQILGTTIEAYAVSGTPTPEDWASLFAALEAGVPSTVAEARRTTFAERNYWTRWNRPVGPWDSHEFTRVRWMRPNPDTFDQVAWASTPDVWAPMPGAPDSIATGSAGSAREMQVLFRQPMTLNYTSWLRIRDPPDAEGPVAPRDPRYPKLTETTEIRGAAVQYSGLGSAGPWFLTWMDRNRSYELHVRAQRGLDASRALQVVSAMRQ